MQRRGTILVVDDNAENRALAEATLADEGYRVVLATGGEEGIAAFGREQPACILLDIRMPGMDGIAACREIRARPGGDLVPVIFVTAQRDVETFDEAVAAGGDDFITKPFRPNELVVRVQTALRLRKIAVERAGLYAELKHQRDALQRLQLQKEQLVAFLVHDLKNPVATIDLQASRLRRDPDGSDRSRSAAVAIQDETRALMRMITNLLDIAKADEGQLAPARRVLDPRELVEPVVAELRARATAAGLVIASRVEARTLHADPDLLHRVLANLIENAIRHAPEGSTIEVHAREIEGATELRVADAGPGVPPALRDQVFERFQRGDTSARGANRGLGLAFCKLAVEAHGGTISIEDGDPGAVFSVRIHHDRWRE
jgi:two-component system sensor histidine kinase/response regulator